VWGGDDGVLVREAVEGGPGLGLVRRVEAIAGREGGRLPEKRAVGFGRERVEEDGAKRGVVAPEAEDVAV
jgi:hypothetical protein